MCLRCWQLIGRRIAHPNPCNCSKFFRQLLANAAELIASNMIKKKFAAFEDGGSNAILATRGSDLTVTKSINSEKSRARYCSNPVSSKQFLPSKRIA